jgi:hypothetical protein
VTYILNPPTVREGPAGFGRLFYRYPVHRGDTLLVTDGVVTRVRTPSIDEFNAAQQVYQGGHVYELSQAEHDLLVAAGYADYITTV